MQKNFSQCERNPKFDRKVPSSWSNWPPESIETYGNFSRRPISSPQFIANRSRISSECEQVTLSEEFHNFFSKLGQPVLPFSRTGAHNWPEKWRGKTDIMLPLRTNRLEKRERLCQAFCQASQHKIN
eukprot:g79389.t1